MSQAVRYHTEGTVGVLTLDRPDNRNSMTPELLDAFAEASAQARGDAEIRALVVTGTGHCFSSGADFKATLQRDGNAAPHERSYAMYAPFLSLLDVAVPIVGALNGHAVGGGFGLALVCDLRIGAEDAKYGANFVKLGLAPGLAISYLLPRLIGVARANELLFTGRLVEGREAAALGILNRALPAAQVLPAAMELANEIARRRHSRCARRRRRSVRASIFTSARPRAPRRSRRPRRSRPRTARKASLRCSASARP